MAGKRRFDSLTEGPEQKRNCLRIYDDVTVDYDPIKSEEIDELTAEGDFVDKIKDEPNCDEDEKPVICEVPVEEFDDVDPLGPLAEDELKEELCEGNVKSEDYGSDELKNSVEDPGFHGTTRPQDSGKNDIHQDQRVFEPRLEVNAQRSASNRAHQVPAMNPHIGVESEIELPRSLSKPSRKSPSRKSVEGSSLFIQLLTETNFLMKDRTVEQENNVIQSGRPMPSLKSPAFAHLEERFWAGAKEYQQIPWLTGFKKLLKHYCWPCLLFSRERWTLMAGTTEDAFWKAIKLHELSCVHKVANKYLQLREGELGLKEEKIVEPQPKTIVKMNRNLLALLIRILCMKKTKLQNIDSDYDGYEELMKVAISYDEAMNESFGNQPNDNGLRDFVSRHAEKVLTSIRDKISTNILEEISNTPFVSIIYEDAESVVDRKTKVAAIVRYVTAEGVVCERFVKFVKVGPSRNAYDIVEIHCGVIEELGIRRKLVGITFSGTVIAPGSIGELNHLVSEASPKAKFFNHPDHNLKETLLQSLSHLEDCRKFFEVISDLVKFLTTNSGAIPTLITFIKFSDPNCKLTADGNSFTVGIISTIRQYYSHILQFFFKVSKKFWNDEVAKHAPIFMKFLQDPFNRFLIVIIASVLDTVDNLSQLMEKEFSLMECKTEVAKVLEKLTVLQSNGSRHFPQLASDSQAQGNEDREKFCSETFSNIVDMSIKCVHNRVRNLDVFSHKFPCARVSEVLQAPEIWGMYGKKFDSVKDFKDLMSFVTLHKTLFKDKSMADIVKTVCEMKLPKHYTDWPEFLRFCALAVLPPKSTPSAPSTVLRLKSYMKDKISFNTADAMMFLEKDRLHSLVKTPEFIDDVINHYATKNNKHNFLDTEPLEVGNLE